MDWTAIVVALFAAAGTGFGSMYGIKKSNDLISYRIDKLEEKMDKHNCLVEKVYSVEKAIEVHDEKLKVVNHRINDLGAGK